MAAPASATTSSVPPALMVLALGVDVGILDAGPRLDQRDGRGASAARGTGMQEPLAGPGR